MGIRASNGTSYLFLLNYSGESVIITMKKSSKDLLTGTWIEGEVSMPPYGVLILELFV